MSTDKSFRMPAEDTLLPVAPPTAGIESLHQSLTHCESELQARPVASPRPDVSALREEVTQLSGVLEQMLDSFELVVRQLDARLRAQPDFQAEFQSLTDRLRMMESRLLAVDWETPLSERLEPLRAKLEEIAGRAEPPVAPPVDFEPMSANLQQSFAEAREQFDARIRLVLDRLDRPAPAVTVPLEPFQDLKAMLASMTSEITSLVVGAEVRQNDRLRFALDELREEVTGLRNRDSSDVRQQVGRVLAALGFTIAVCLGAVAYFTLLR